MDSSLKTIDQWRELGKAASYRSSILAGMAQLSSRQLQRVFRKRFGVSPQEWLDKERMAAANLFLLSGKSIKSTAFDLGFKQTSHFCRHFKAAHSMTPSEFIYSTLEASRPLPHVAPG